MQKAAEEIIRSHWRSFFNSTIPALHNQTPNEAAKSANGQRLLSELLNFYDQFNSKSSGMELRTSDGFSSNPPSAWVKWRLKFPGHETIDESKFAKEEAFFNGDSKEAELLLNSSPKAKLPAGKNICNVCLKEASMVCGRCNARRYCNRECQKADWIKHKPFCNSQNEAKGGVINNNQKKRNMDWNDFKDLMSKGGMRTLLTGEMNLNEKLPSWDELMNRAVAEGIMEKHMVELDRDNKLNDIMKGDKKNLEKLTLKLLQLHDTMVSDMNIEDPNTRKALAKNQKILETNKKNFTELTPDKYRALPQYNTSLTVTFTCTHICKKTGRNSYIILVHWSNLSDDDHQIVYSSMFASHTIPSLYEFKKAIHCALIAPSGIRGYSCIPHRPNHIEIHNRWTYEYYDAVRLPIINSDIGVSFQTREAAEEICRQEGTDPDGANII